MIKLNPIYIITGAAGFLGNNIVRILLQQNKGEVRALVLPGDDLISLNGLDCEIVKGNVLEKESLLPLFHDDEGREVFVIHCAGAVDIASGYSSKVYDVNVEGTRNVCQICLEKQAKLVYISSVHAMAPTETSEGILPAKTYNPDEVPGLYAKVKARASQIVLDTVSRGLHACLVQPSGLIGPYDYSNSNLTQFIVETANEKLPACVSAGYSFVDVRDATMAIINACENGKDGISYLVAGPTTSMMEIAKMVSEDNHSRPVRFCIPLGLVEAVTPLTTLYYRYTRQKPLFTSFAVRTLETPSNFNITSSQQDLCFHPRPLKDTIHDTVAFLKSIFRIDTDSVIENGKPVSETGNSKALFYLVGIAAGLAGLSLLNRKRKS